MRERGRAFDFVAPWKTHRDGRDADFGISLLSLSHGAYIKRTVTFCHSSPSMTISTPSSTEYWGVAAIAKRLSVSPEGLRALHRRDAFLMFRRRRARVGRGRSPVTWYTNEALIQRWELARCRLDHQDVILSAGRSGGRPISTGSKAPA